MKLKEISLIELNEKKDIKIIVNKYNPSFIIESDETIGNGPRRKKKKEKNNGKKITEYFYIDENDN